MLIEIRPYRDEKSKGVLDHFSVELAGVPAIKDRIVIERFNDGKREVDDSYRGLEEYEVTGVYWLGWLTMSGHGDEKIKPASVALDCKMICNESSSPYHVERYKRELEI